MHTTSLPLSLSCVIIEPFVFVVLFLLSLYFKYFPLYFLLSLTLLCLGSIIFLSSDLVPQNSYISPSLEPPTVTV
uniref:Uncharacterized protein n=1 Tax=Populus trichocarpa TaxID=3694 RepID=U5G397_POPTR